jgi:predicted PurR-regulated permease PerM
MNQRASSYFFFILLVGVSISAVFIFLPFITPLAVGAAVAVMMYPAYRMFSRIFLAKDGKSNISAFITTLLFLVVIATPILLLLAKMYGEIQTLYSLLTDESGRSQLISSLNDLSQTLSRGLFDIFPVYSFDSLNVTEYLKNILEWVFTNLDVIFGRVFAMAGYAFVFILALFYFLRDGQNIMKRFISWSPQLESNEVHIVRTLKRAIQSVFAGAVVVSVIQGILTGIGFSLFGIPAPTLWGACAAIAAFIPGLGTSLVVIPGIIYLFVTGQTMGAIGLVFWGVLAIGLVDNILGPVLVNKGINIHPFLVLVSVLGGLAVFGPLGFILGPLILSLLFALLDVYKQAFPSTKNSV